MQLFTKTPEKEETLDDILEGFERTAARLENFVETKEEEKKAIEAKLNSVTKEVERGSSVMTKFKDLLS